MTRSIYICINRSKSGLTISDEEYKMLNKWLDKEIRIQRQFSAYSLVLVLLILIIVIGYAFFKT